MDTTLIGITTAKGMEALESEYGHDETARVVEVVVIVAVHTDTPPNEEWEQNEDGYSFVHTYASEGPWYRQLGLVEAGSQAISEGAGYSAE